MTTVYRVRHQLCVLAALVLVVAGLTRSVRAQEAAVPGVRSTSPAIRQLLDDAMWESPTFRGLVKAIRATDGIVYVEEGECRHGVHACLLMTMTATSGYRILHVLVDLHGVLAHRNRLDLLATLGHELWHALEVLGERALRSPAEVFLFYDRLAAAHPAFETDAAVAAGIKIRKEVGRQTTFVWQQVALDLP